MHLTINAERLSQLIAEEVPATRGACVTTGMCIGKINGRQIQLVIQADRDEFMSEHKKFVCVSEAGPKPSTVQDEVAAEMARAAAKFPTWPTDPLHALAVLGEEFGELTKAVLQGTYEPGKQGPGAARKEAIQTAAMAIRFAMSLDRYRYAGCHQHKQA